MRKLKDIEKELGNSCWRSDNNQTLMIKACAVGDNFYDYGEKPVKTTYEYYPDLENDPRISIIECEDCCALLGGDKK